MMVFANVNLCQIMGGGGCTAIYSSEMAGGAGIDDVRRCISTNKPKRVVGELTI